MNRYRKYLEIMQKFEIRLRSMMNIATIGVLVGLLDLAVGLVFVLKSRESSDLPNATDFTHLGVLIASILIARSFLGYFMQKNIAILGQSVAKDIVNRLGSVFLKIPIKNLLIHDFGYLLNASTNWANLIGGNLISPLIAIVSDLILLALLVALLTLILGVKVLLIFVLSGLFCYLIYRITSSKVAEAANVGVMAGVKLHSLINSSLLGAREIRQFNLEQNISDEINNLAGVQAEAQSKKNYLAAIPRLVIEFIGSLLIFAITSNASNSSSSHLQSVTLFAFFLIRFLPLAGRMASNVNALKFAEPIVEPLLEILKIGLTVELKTSSSAVEKAPLQIDSLSLSSYSFGFGSRVFGSSINRQFSRGSICALTGRSGSGKSTFLDCLSGFQEPLAGTVEYRIGKEIIEVDNLSHLSVLVSQQTHLFPGTLSWNLHFCEDADDSILRRTRELFGLVGLPESYLNSNIVVGSSSSGFSGGELQRISLVRAILQDKPILLLDEVSSGLDDNTKRMVMELLEDLSQSKVIIMATHDESMLEIAREFMNLSEFIS